MSKRTARAAAALIALTSCAGPPTKPSSAQPIVYESSEAEGKPALYLVEPGGFSSVIPNSIGASGPSWSPRHELIAFIAQDDNEFPDEGQLRVTDANGTIERELNARGLAPSWAPDSSRLAYSRSQEIWTVSLDSGSTQRLMGRLPEDLANASISDELPSWAAAGGVLAFQRETFISDATGRSIWIVEEDGSGQRKLTEGLADGHPDWSPDGMRIIFTRPARVGSGNSNQLWMMDRDGSNLKLVLEISEDGSIECPAWSPDGSRIAFVHAGSETDGRVAVVGPEGRDLSFVDTTGDAACLDW